MTAAQQAKAQAKADVGTKAEAVKLAKAHLVGKAKGDKVAMFEAVTDDQLSAIAEGVNLVAKLVEAEARIVASIEAKASMLLGAKAWPMSERVNMKAVEAKGWLKGKGKGNGKAEPTDEGYRAYIEAAFSEAEAEGGKRPSCCGLADRYVAAHRAAEVWRWGQWQVVYGQLTADAVIEAKGVANMNGAQYGPGYANRVAEAVKGADAKLAKRAEAEATKREAAKAKAEATRKAKAAEAAKARKAADAKAKRQAKAEATKAAKAKASKAPRKAAAA